MDLEDDKLETFFTEARAAPPELSDAALARILADADRARPAPAVRAHKRPLLPGWLSWLRDLGPVPGGWRAAGGVALAGLAGFWIGWADTSGLGAALAGGDDGFSLVPDEVAVLVDAAAAT